MKYKNIREEELKNKVGADWFSTFDTTEILGNIDFTVLPKQDSLFGRTPLLWAEAKTGNFDIPTMFVQLILTIGKARTFDKTLPPAFLGAFDFKKIAFVDYINIQDIFFLNDFNWNVTPSKHDTKEFQLIKERIESVLKVKTYVFDYQKDEKELKTFIKNNVAKASTKNKIKIDKNNFIPIYLRWIEIVKPIIDVNWDELKKNNILDSDFYLADLFVDDKDTQNIDDDLTIRESLFVVYQNQGYKIAKENLKQMFDATISIKQKETYQQFWKLYKRPPIKEFQDYIIERRDLLVPQDIRERKGAFFTPRIWVELSQKYLTDYLGEDWQDEYYIWDCAAGTGNLLAGLTNKYNIYASTLDQADINVMHERIDHGANLLHKHVFQFDFLNDDFIPVSKGGKMPDSLHEIINNEEKRKKLVVYINPPYAEHGNRATFAGEGEHKSSVANTSKIYTKFNKIVGTATRELFAQFFLRVHDEIPDCHLASFSTLKFVNSQNFLKFRQYFKGEFKSGFICKANTFDNVKGNFPIGFLIWDLSKKNAIKKVETDIINEYSEFIGLKSFYTFGSKDFISSWLRKFYDKENEALGYLILPGVDMQQQNGVYVTSQPTESDIKAHKTATITKKNLIEMAIYLSIRIVIEPTWLNNRDQFLVPNENWKTDNEFQNDCLAYSLFAGQNRITSKDGLNHWITFTEQEVNAQERFESHFMTDFINGKIKKATAPTLFTPQNSPSKRGLGGVLSKSGLGGVLSKSGLEEVKFTKQYLHSQGINPQNLIFSDYFLPYNPNLKEKSRILRKAGNLSEVLLWMKLRADSFLGYSFYRQKPILNYIVDFYCKELNLVIEIDGASHNNNEQAEYDKERDRQMKVLGLSVLRIRDEEVKNDMPNVLRKIEDFIKTPPNFLEEETLPNFLEEETPPNPLEEGELKFSVEAAAVFDAGRVLWKYYHSKPNVNVNASLYDIREYFQGRNDKGRMNPKSDDETYMELIGELRNKLNFLADKIKPKIYEYEFLKE